MKYITQHSHGLSKNQKWVIASTSSGFALENMDVRICTSLVEPLG